MWELFKTLTLRRNPKKILFLGRGIGKRGTPQNFRIDRTSKKDPRARRNFSECGNSAIKRKRFATHASFRCKQNPAYVPSSIPNRAFVLRLFLKRGFFRKKGRNSGCKKKRINSRKNRILHTLKNSSPRRNGKCGNSPHSSRPISSFLLISPYGKKHW